MGQYELDDLQNDIDKILGEEQKQKSPFAADRKNQMSPKEKSKSSPFVIKGLGLNSNQNSPKRVSFNHIDEIIPDQVFDELNNGDLMNQKSGQLVDITENESEDFYGNSMIESVKKGSIKNQPTEVSSEEQFSEGQVDQMEQLVDVL